MTMTETVNIVIEAGRTDDTRAKEIIRNLQVLYATIAGEQALDRDFGISRDVMDNPLESAKALLAAEYVRKTERYEPRARVIRVEWENQENTGDKAKSGRLTPKVVIGLV